MELSEILAQPDGFTPPSATVKIKKVWPRKEGQGDNGPWSFQNVEVEGGRLKLKRLPEFPKAREGQSVTLRANQSKQHGLTGIKVNHEQYNGSTFHQLVITSSCKWEWAGSPASNGGQVAAPAPQNVLSDVAYTDHLLSCAELANLVTARLAIEDPVAIQACFATICIDTKNRNILLPKPKTMVAENDNTTDRIPDNDEPPPEYEDDGVPF